jgi:hypothetical protein
VVAAHVFISYSRDDLAYVERLAAYLRAEGIPVWFDRHILEGSRWAEVIADKIDTCAAAIIVMSPGAERSKWISREIGRAEEKDKTIVPVLRAGRPFFQISDIQYVDATQGQMPSPAILEHLRGLLAAAASPPPTRPDPAAAAADVRPALAEPEPTRGARPRWRRGLLVVVLVAAVAGGVVAAVQRIDQHPQTDQPSGEPPSALLTAALAKLNGQSYNLTLSLLNHSTTGHGSVDAAHDSASAELTTSALGQPIDIVETEVGSTIWLKINIGTLGSYAGIDPTKWLLIDRAKIATGMIESFDLTGTDALDLAGLLSTVSGVTRIDATHLTGTADLLAATGVSRPRPETLTAAGAAAMAVPFTVTLDDQGRLTDLILTGTGPASGLTQEFGISSYSAATPVTAPAPATVIDAPPVLYQFLNG